MVDEICSDLEKRIKKGFATYLRDAILGPADQSSQEGNVSMAPIGLSVAADLGKLAPKLATSDSSFGSKQL